MRFISMVTLIGLAFLNNGQKPWRRTKLLNVIDLLLIVVINESLDSSDRGVDRPPPKKRRNGTG
jgi:hypothetical protein